MEIKDYEELKKKLCKELEEIKTRNKLGMAEIEVIDKLTHSIKNIDRIMESEDEGGYSQARYSRRYSRDNYSQGDYSRDGNWSAEGSYNGGNSYANRGMHYVRGHYSRANDDMLTERIEEMMDDSRLTMEDRKTLERAMNIIRK